MNNTSDSAGINMDADALFALYQMEGEREMNRMNIKILKNRLGGFVDRTFQMYVNYETLKISDWNGSDDDTELDEMLEETDLDQKDLKDIDETFNNL